MIVELVLAALAISAAGSAVVAYRRQRREKAEHAAALMAPRYLKDGDLLPNDVIVHLGADYLVVGVTTLSEGAQKVLVVAWMTDGSKAKQLVVNPKEQPRCVLAEPLPAENLGGAIPTWVASGDLKLKLAKRASVRMKGQGECALPDEGACEYGLFEGPGARRAVALMAGGELLILAGRAVTEAGLELLPGGTPVLDAG